MCTKAILTLPAVLWILTTTAAEPTTPTAEPTTGSELESYALEQMNFILDHMLRSSKDFVIRVLAHNVNITLRDRSSLKRFLEEVNQVLDVETTAAVTNERISRKLAFLKGLGMKELGTHLPDNCLREYKTHKDSIAAWLNKTAESMRTQFSRHTLDDPLRHQHFNNLFDDVPTANDALQKLDILVEMTDIVVNKTPIRFVDLYMQ